LIRNVWQRLGLIASIIWLPVGYFGEEHLFRQDAFDRSMAYYRICASDAPLVEAQDKCSRTRNFVYSTQIKSLRANAVAGAVLPIASAWLLAYVFLTLSKWALGK
jgi:hypothetical protein